MSTPLAWLNGRLVPQAEAVLPVHDAGLVFGAAVTDFCRTFHRRLYRWPEHLDRLYGDADACFIPLTGSPEELTRQAESLVEHNAALLPPGEELALVTFATPGGLGVYAGTDENGPPTLVMHTFPLPRARYRRFFSEGVTLATAGRVDFGTEALAPPWIKHRSRLQWWRAEHFVLACEGATSGALAMPLTQAGCITETAIGTVLVVIDGAVIAPRVETVLAGISLGVVQELCGRLGIEFLRSELLLEELVRAKEAMICGSAFCLAGIRHVNGEELPWPGPITQRLLAAWGEEVGQDIAGWFTGGTP